MADIPQVPSIQSSDLDPESIYQPKVYDWAYLNGSIPPSTPVAEQSRSASTDSAISSYSPAASALLALTLTPVPAATMPKAQEPVLATPAETPNTPVPPTTSAGPLNALPLPPPSGSLTGMGGIAARRAKKGMGRMGHPTMKFSTEEKDMSMKWSDAGGSGSGRYE